MFSCVCVCRYTQVLSFWSWDLKIATLLLVSLFFDKTLVLLFCCSAVWYFSTRNVCQTKVTSDGNLQLQRGFSKSRSETKGVLEGLVWALDLFCRNETSEWIILSGIKGWSLCEWTILQQQEKCVNHRPSVCPLWFYQPLKDYIKIKLHGA